VEAGESHNNAGICVWRERQEKPPSP
jgi:hypothetical protein